MTKKITEKVKRYLKEIKKNNKKGNKVNALLEINPDLLKQAAELDKKKSQKGKLYGKIIAIKSNINVKGLICSCASKTLANYISPYNATVIEKIRQEDGLIIGMANCDEFACGSSGETSAFGDTKNPNALERIPGGSSSGSAAAVAAGFCDLALGSDTGGSIRNPASHCGVVGVKPTYGLVSRYGLIDLAMSFDQIGPLARNIDDALLLLNVIRGKDEKDTTSFESKEVKIEKLGKIKIGIPEIKIDNKIEALVNKQVEGIARKNNWQIEKIKLPHINLGIQTYYPIVYTEFFSGTRKLDGRRFGKKIEDSCGEEVLRRILGGREITQAEYEGKYYRKALQARSLITKEFEKAFEKVDCIIMPTTPKLPHKLGENISVEDMYNYDSLTVLANLSQIPAMSLPAGKINGIPVGLQILYPRFEEGRMFSVAREFEDERKS